MPKKHALLCLLTSDLIYFSVSSVMCTTFALLFLQFDFSEIPRQSQHTRLPQPPQSGSLAFPIKVWVIVPYFFAFSPFFSLYGILTFIQKTPAPDPDPFLGIPFPNPPPNPFAPPHYPIPTSG